MNQARVVSVVVSWVFQMSSPRAEKGGGGGMMVVVVYKGGCKGSLEMQKGGD